MLSMFGQTVAPQKVAPQARECGACLWRVATFESLLCAAWRSLALLGSVRRIVKTEIYDVTYLFIS